MAKIFLWQGFFMGGVGTLMGFIGALVVCALLARFRFIELSPEIYFLSFLPVEIRGIEVLVVMCGITVISILASVLPAVRAARLYPVEGIRYE